MHRRLFITVALLLVGCASSGRQASEESTGSYVTGADLRDTGHTTLEGALREVRPRWFNLGRETADFTRSGSIEVCRGNLILYLDGERSDEPLSRVPLTNIDGVRLIRAAGLRPDGSRGCPETPAIHVMTIDESR